MTRVRRQPETVLGGSLVRTKDGYRAVPQYTPSYPTPMTVKQIYSNAKQRRYPPRWDEKELDAQLIIYFTYQITLLTGCCHRRLGPFVAYRAGAEYGVIRDEARQRHPLGNFPTDQFASQPNDSFEPKRPSFWLDGEVGGKAANAWAHFRCPKCEREFNPRNLRRLGKQLYEQRPKSYQLPAP